MLDALKTSVDMKGAREAAADPGNFSHLSKCVQYWMDSLPAQETQTDQLRASGLHGVCPREFVLNYWQPKPNRSFDYKSMMRMNMGTFAHSYLQNHVLGPMGILWGEWRVFESGFEDDCVSGFMPQEKCIYQEETVYDELHRISGHLDGKICSARVSWLANAAKLAKSNPMEACKRMGLLEPGELFLLEIKTSGSYVFDKLNGPNDIADYYKMQASIYQALSGVKKTVFWFIQRDTLDSKVFVYDFEPGWWNEAKRKARIIWEAIRDETLPESMMACKMPTDKRAKACVFKDPCWSKRLDFKAHIVRGKMLAERSGRKLLDLSGVTFEDAA